MDYMGGFEDMAPRRRDDASTEAAGAESSASHSRGCNKNKRYRRKSNELDKVFPCPVRFCPKK